MFARITNVYERELGSRPSVAVLPTGFIALLASGSGSGYTLVLTVTQDSQGDSFVISGGEDANILPSSIVDSKGNTYYLAPRPLHGGSGPDIVSTTGLSSTVWIAHGIQDGGHLQAGDTVTLTYPASQSECAAVLLDMNGVSDISSDDKPSGGTDFGLIATRPTFNPATVSGPLPVVADNSVYVAAVYGSRHKQHVEFPSGAIIDDYSNPTVNEGTPVAYAGGSERAIQVNVDVISSGFAPSRQMSAGEGWAEGATLAYTSSVTSDTLFLVDTSDFDDAGQLVINDEIYDYEVVNEDTGEVALTPALASAVDEDTFVSVYPNTTERIAVLIEADGSRDEEGMLARVPHALYDKIHLGIRDLTIGSGETITADYFSDEFVIIELMGKRPTVDGSYIDGTTLPQAHDGFPPASPSPHPDVIVGDDHLKARWTAVSLNSNGDPQVDLVAYDVYVIAVSDTTAATLDIGSGDGEYLLTAVELGPDGNDITLTVTT